MKLRATVVVIAAAFALSACSSTSEGYVNSSGSVALSKDDALVYAADSDSNTLFVLDPQTLKEVAHVQVGQQPEKILVAPDDTIYVTNRMSRSISVIRRGDWKEAAQLQTGVEPVALGISADGHTLYVVNATQLTTAESGSLMAFDTNTLQQKYEIAVGPEPRGLAVLPDGKAMVNLMKQGDVALVDLNKQAVVKSGTDVNSRLNANGFGGVNTGVNDGTNPSPPGGQGFGPNGALNTTVHGRGFVSMAVSPDGAQVYTVGSLSSNATLVGDVAGANVQTVPAGSSGDGYGGGSCGATAVSSPAVLTFSNAAEPKVGSVTTCGGQVDPTVPAMVLNSGNAQQPVQGPVAIVADPTGSFLYVVNQQTDNVAIVPTTQRQAADQSGGLTPNNSFQVSGASTVRALINTGITPSGGAGPTGIALTHDGLRAFVYNSFEHSIALIQKDPQTGALESKPEWKATVTTDTLSLDAAKGRSLFFNAVDSRMNNPGVGIACATCHVESREDGHVWNFTDGPRQTPSLAGRMTDQTAPYHWSGVFPTLGDFMSQTVAHRMGGSGFDDAMANQISAYIKVIPVPDNPNRLATPSAQQQRGAQVFASAACGSCHAGAAMTDNAFHQVGTMVSQDNNNLSIVFDDPTALANGFNTPSLLGLARTAPYLHNGAALTIKDRLLRDRGTNGIHGDLANLNDAQLDDLSAYLSSL